MMPQTELLDRLEKLRWVCDVIALSKDHGKRMPEPWSYHLETVIEAIRQLKETSYDRCGSHRPLA